MSLRLRPLLFWLLAMALSLQGASAAATHCCAGAGAVGTHTGMAMSAPMVMSAAAATIHQDADRTAPTAIDHKTLPHSSAEKCGACSPCCIAAAPPATRLGVFRVDVSQAIAGTVAIPISSFLTEGQDRPPRSILA